MGTPFEGGTDAEVNQGVTLADAVHSAGIDHLVFTSVAGADADTGIPHFDSKFAVERHIEKTGVPFTIIAPVFFVDNWRGPWMLPSIKEGAVAAGIPGDRKLQQVVVRDIGRFVTYIFENRDEFLGQRIDIASDELNGEQVAEIIGRHAGRKLTYQQTPLETIRRQSEDMAIMYEWFDQVGYSVEIAQLRDK